MGNVTLHPVKRTRAMPATVRTHNAYHLGDNLIHLNFLRRLAIANPDRSFIHAAKDPFMRQLRDVVADIPNIQLANLDTDPYYAFCDAGSIRHKDSLNAWRGSGGDWYRHPNRNNFSEYHRLHWFPKLGSLMGLANVPILGRMDMLFDYPALQNPVPLPFGHGFDVLVINSPPWSGQWNGYNAVALGAVAKEMARKGASVIATAPIPDRPDSPPVLITSDYGLDVTQIGQLSTLCHTILMVSTGPSWTTFNTWNKDSVRHRIILIDSERIDLAPNTHHCSKIGEASSILRDIGLL